MGGEKLILLVTTPGREGSPPHGRGKVMQVCIATGLRGITPAWAGKSCRAAAASTRGRDHPRMGGEKAANFLAVCGPRGSPPHGRGKGPALHCSSPVPGITPAWAGKRALQAGAGYPAGDHPRMGGEKLAGAAAVTQRQGSPPHGRGKGPHLQKTAVRGGITPAWAGKSPGCAILSVQREDHPRMGGEKVYNLSDKALHGGSPPHGRGKAKPKPVKTPVPRITPAWAGKRSCS